MIKQNSLTQEQIDEIIRNEYEIICRKYQTDWTHGDINKKAIGEFIKLTWQKALQSIDTPLSSVGEPDDKGSFQSQGQTVKASDVREAVKKLKEFLICFDEDIYVKGITGKDMTINSFIDILMKEIHKIFGEELI